MRRLRILVGLVVVMLSVSFVLAAPANAAVRAQYQITVTGTAGGWSYRNTGLLTVADTVTRVTNNGVNPIDVCLLVADPWAVSPVPGAMRYGSNSACWSGSGANLDMVFSALNGIRYSSNPDSRVAGTQVNGFVGRGGVTGCIYAPTSGTLVTDLGGRNVTGSVFLTGYGGAFCGSTNYVGNVSGVRIR